MIEIGSVVDGKYRILSEIGRGGMSVVYLALNERANKTWAIKEVRKDGGNDAEVVTQNLVAETEMLKRLHHPNLPSIVDVIDYADSFLIVMDYVEGIDMKKLLDREGPQSEEDVMNWAKQLCDVLGYLHSRMPPIIYRDMKPANVMLKPDRDNVVLLDFGTAIEQKDVHTGLTTVLGTVEYAAPEMSVSSALVDERSDIYTLGATMYHMLTGLTKADTNSVFVPLGELNPALRGSALEIIVAKCCAPKPEERYQSCGELMYDLEHPDEITTDIVKKRKRQWVGFLSSLAVMVIALVGALGFHQAEVSATDATYESYLAQARSQDLSFGADSGGQYFQSAVNLRPSSQDAYSEMLDGVETDMIFSVAESNMVQDCVFSTHNGVRRNIDYLESSNRSAYDNFVYRLANDYYFFYEGSDNRSKAAYWYELIEDSAYLTEQQKELATDLRTIGNYYSSLGSDKTVYAVGSNANNFLTFWNQMVALTDGNVVEKTGGTRYAVALYREMVNQIYTNTARFKSFGITQRAMEEQLDKVSDALEDLVPESTMIAQQIQETEALITTARGMVESSYKEING